MKQLIKDLYSVLNEKIRLYDRFESCLKDEWEGLVKYSHPDFEKARKKKEILTQEMIALELRRAHLMDSIGKELDLSKGGLTLKGIIQRLPELLAQKFMSVRKRLLVQIRNITRFNDRIKNLIDRTSLSFHKSLAFVHSLDEKQHSPYSAKGQFCESKLPSRMFSMSA
ncbi:MAG: hypothetical protein COV66_08720 [Nitrospinae bacterium CG11_big_fil_rev_8_21_14_0_20_45_15]|nr:MAG: hypothetical protein COV66_08720 [Nitrospinae bacterium CG11_big_fil_rev_8_21_14_0_20_45_15]